MADIVLSTLNAKYAHSAFGLRYLMANLGDLRTQARMLEFDVSQRPQDVLEMVLEQAPRIVGVGVYIWNKEPATKLVSALKSVRPQVTVVLGGPEVSFETENQEIVHLADFVICGEADLALAELCAELLSGERPSAKIIRAQPPDFGRLKLPYELYSDEDIAHRVIYVESSRGCPFGCEFCLSSVDSPVRYAPREPFLHAMQSLLDRGARRFKFVDRTFNVDLDGADAVLRFFLDRYRPGLFLHFEMIPDRFPQRLRSLIERFPAGALQFELGVQTFNAAVATRVRRRQNNAKVEENLRFLRARTGVHLHTDLIIGLPGETVESFAAGFDRLVALLPHEIQVGVLKRLRGAPITRHDQSWNMVYSPFPPYEILQNRDIDFATMQRLRRFARYWDLLANSGNFIETTPLLWAGGSPFNAFLSFSDWLYARAHRTHGIALTKLVELVFRYLVEEAGRPGDEVATALLRDYRRTGRSDRPRCLRPYDSRDSSGPGHSSPNLPRQGRFST